MSYFLKLAALCACALAATGCQKQGSETTPTLLGRSEDRPRVALVPVIDRTAKAYDWNLGDEMSEGVATHLVGRGAVTLEPEAQIRTLAKKIKGNPFGPQIGWVKEAFRTQQFVAFLELITHEEVFRTRNAKDVDLSTCAADLNMSMRVRVFDIRGKEPVVILQEIVQDTHFIPKQFTRVNFEQVSWGDEDFNFSPIGMAHVQFEKQIARRIEEYIRIAVSHAL